MSQLILASKRDDGDYDTIAAIQNDPSLDMPALEWVLQMKEYMVSENEGVEYVILRREELVDVLVDVDADMNDVTALCEAAFNKGQTCL